MIPFALRFPGPSEKMSEKAIASLELQREKSPADLWALARYYHLTSVGDDHLDRAKRWYEEIIKLDKENAAMARNNIGCILSDMGRYPDSEKTFQQIVNTASPLITAYFNLYILYKYSGREGDAVKALLLMHERYPESIYASLELGDLFFEKGNFVEAEKYYQEGIRSDAENPVPLYKMARLKENMKLYADAENYYRQCIERFPYFHYAYLDYSNMLLDLNRKEEAKKILGAGLKKMGK